MRYLLIIILLGLSMNVYAFDTGDILDKPDYDTDQDGGDMTDSFNTGLGLASGALNHSKLRDGNAYDISVQRDIITGGQKNLEESMKAVNGDKNANLKLLTGEKTKYKAPECRVGQEQIARLVIPNGSPSSISLYLYQPTNINYEIPNVSGVCDNKFTVCSIDTNKDICKQFLKRDGVEQGTELESSSNVMDNHIAESNICNNIIECMSWRFVKYEDNGTGKSKLSVEPAGRNCGRFANNTITVSQKDMIIQNLTAVLGKLANENNLGTLSDTKLDNSDNTNTDYFVLKNSCDNLDNISKDTYSGMTDLNDLTAYYNNTKDVNTKTDEDRKKQHDELLSQSPIGQKLDNSSKNINKLMKDNQTFSDKFNNMSTNLKKGNEMAGSIMDKVSIPHVCYTPNCTVDIVMEDDKGQMSAQQGKTAKPLPSSKRMFRACEAVGYVDTGGIKKTQYKCPVTTGVAGLTETPVAQDRSKLPAGEEKTKILALDSSIAQVGNELYCSCYNEHEYKTNMQKTLVATKLAEQMNNASCGDTEYDNDTRETIVDKRNECSKHKVGSEEYNKCMGTSKK